MYDVKKAAVACLSQPSRQNCDTQQQQQQQQQHRRQGVNFTNILCTAFVRKDPKSAKYTDDMTVFLCFWDLRM